MNMNIIFWATLLVIAAIAVVVYRAVAEHRKGRKSAAERRRRSNSRLVGIRKCGAELVMIDELAKEEIALGVSHKGPQPLEVGEVFLSCINTCQEAASCPVLRKFLDPRSRHDVTPEDGFMFVKARTFYPDGSAVLTLEEVLDEKNTVVHGAEFHGKGNGRCYIRTDPPNHPANDSGKEAPDDNGIGGGGKN